MAHWFLVMGDYSIKMQIMMRQELSDVNDRLFGELAKYNGG